MAKATILSAAGEGQYQVQVAYDRTRAEAEIAARQADISVITERLTALGAEITTAQLARDSAYQTLQSKISLLTAAQNSGDPGEEEAARGEVVMATSAYRSSLEALTTLQTEQRGLRLRKVSAENRIQSLQDNLPADHEVTAWCADYNAALSGEVGLIETGLVEGPPYIIKPAGDSAALAAYDQASDGQLTPVLSMTPAAAMLNYGRLPGLTKWRPRYRTGVVTALDTDTDLADIDLDAATSGHQALGINQSTVLTDVPVEYLSCNAKAFTVGDQVVVAFTDGDWSQPKLVGFVDHPKPCETQPYLFIQSIPFVDEIEYMGNWVEPEFFDGLRTRTMGAVDSYGVTPGHLIDMRDGSVVEILHPDTGEPMTETERFSYLDNRIAWKGLYAEVIAEILGITFISDSTTYTTNGSEFFGAAGKMFRAEQIVEQDFFGGANALLPDWWPWIYPKDVNDPPEGWSIDGTNTPPNVDMTLTNEAPAAGTPILSRSRSHIDADGTVLESAWIASDGSESAVHFDDDTDLTIEVHRSNPHLIDHTIKLRGVVVASCAASSSADHVYQTGTEDSYDYALDISSGLVGAQQTHQVTGAGTAWDAENASQSVVGPVRTSVLQALAMACHLNRSAMIDTVLLDTYNGMAPDFDTFEGHVTLKVSADNPMSYGSDPRDNDSYDQAGGTWSTLTETDLASLMGLSTAQFLQQHTGLTYMLFAV